MEACVDETIQKPSDVAKSPSCLIECINANSYREDGDFRERLLQEAEQFIVAGTETTGHALSVTTFYILQDGGVQQKLRQELIDADISLDEDLDVASLQRLPYLVSLLWATIEIGNGISSSRKLTCCQICNLVCCHN